MDRLLIVDDDVGWLGKVEQTFETAGYEIKVLNSAAKAAEVIRNWKPAILLLDIVIPEMDGIEVIRELSKTGFPGAIILISQSNEAYLRLAAELASAYKLKVLASMKKPFSSEQLAAVLKDARKPR